MRVLLLGEYSNVHATLARGLRALGCEVTVVSNGDFWKDYQRDIDVSRKKGIIGGIALMVKVLTLLPKLRGYDIVQLINPMFFELKAERLFPIYHYLQRHNRKIVLGAFGMDYYWVKTCTFDRPLRYSDFNIGDEARTDAIAERDRRDWLGTAKGRLNQEIARTCDGIVTGLYEYDVCYRPVFPGKTQFIPYPIQMPGEQPHDAGKTATTVAIGCQPDTDKTTVSTAANGRRSDADKASVTTQQRPNHEPTTHWPRPVRLFIGISKKRSAYKGTDIMLEAAKAVRRKHPDKLELRVANGVPFDEYSRMLDGSDLLMDQLYSYTPAMNALLAMSKGIVVIGGGEPENYAIIHERELRPIVNVQPTFQSVYDELERIVLDPSAIPRLKRENIEYVRKHHDYMKVARQYFDFYCKILAKNFGGERKKH